MAKVEVRDNESLDSALRRFKKQLQRDGTLQEARRIAHSASAGAAHRARKLPTICGPATVSTDSGWNCTPQ